MRRPFHKSAREDLQRLYVYSGGFLTQNRVRRILRLAGWDIRIGLPGPGDWVGVWGQSPTARRGAVVAGRRASHMLRVEDPFLRSVQTGREGEPPLGLLLDRKGVHFDASAPSDLEDLLARHPLDDTALLDRARDCMAWLGAAHISKYNDFDPARALPDAPYVLVIDQTRGDAALPVDAMALFREMLVFARLENPGARIVIKAHPEATAGHRAGHFGPDLAAPDITWLRDPVSPWALFEGATAVYTMSSLLGFEAIMAGHRPRVFGQPFYAGWGLTQDENPVARRTRRLTRAQLFAAAMILYPTWYDPYRKRIGRLEDVIAALEAQSRARREDRAGYVAGGMRMWKRPHLRRFFGPRLRFASTPAKAMATAKAAKLRPLIWAGAAGDHADVVRVEDGFLRSRGLGAALVPPMSLVADDLGIYYDASRPSRLEMLISARASLPDHARKRAEALIARITDARLSKYNLTLPPLPDLPEGRRILVAGQVEDDASIRLGAGAVHSNGALLQAARAVNPDAVILYKPHPDIEAGLRPGAIDGADADMILRDADPIQLIEAVDEVWTITSLLGFEALLRNRPVACLGTPFYAGWGLTRDLGDIPDRRRARPDIVALAHAVLIDYPRYHDPVSGLPCPVEVALDRLEAGAPHRGGRGLRLLAKTQGLLASPRPFWRR